MKRTAPTAGPAVGAAPPGLLVALTSPPAPVPEAAGVLLGPSVTAAVLFPPEVASAVGAGVFSAAEADEEASRQNRAAAGRTSPKEGNDNMLAGAVSEIFVSSFY